MANSGIELSEDVVQKFTDVKSNHKLKYVTYKINFPDKTKIIVDKQLDATDPVAQDCQSCWEKLTEELEDGEPRYILYDVKNQYKDGRKLENIVFVSWCSDNCNIGKKMIHASSKETLKKKLTGISGTGLHAVDRGDLAYEEVLAEARRGK
ncbi:uncharacterized protein [Amphiura filiformis]|uniref:uncharacterized protein n=1 Tax=Amphiura filiformis TaxID=82378 RepID=UPI003B22527A